MAGQIGWWAAVANWVNGKYPAPPERQVPTPQEMFSYNEQVVGDIFATKVLSCTNIELRDLSRLRNVSRWFAWYVNEVLKRVDLNCRTITKLHSSKNMEWLNLKKCIRLEHPSGDAPLYHAKGALFLKQDRRGWQFVECWYTHQGGTLRSYESDWVQTVVQKRVLWASLIWDDLPCLRLLSSFTPLSLLTAQHYQILDVQLESQGSTYVVRNPGVLSEGLRGWLIAHRALPTSKAEAGVLKLSKDGKIIERYKKDPADFTQLNLGLAHGVLREKNDLAYKLQWEVIQYRQAILEKKTPAIQTMDFPLRMASIQIAAMIFLRTFYLTGFMIGYLEAQDAWHHNGPKWDGDDTDFGLRVRKSQGWERCGVYPDDCGKVILRITSDLAAQFFVQDERCTEKVVLPCCCRFQYEKHEQMGDWLVISLTTTITQEDRTWRSWPLEEICCEQAFNPLFDIACEAGPLLANVSLIEEAIRRKVNDHRLEKNWNYQTPHMTGCCYKGDSGVELTFANGQSGVIDLRGLQDEESLKVIAQVKDFSQVVFNPRTKTVSFGAGLELDPFMLRSKIMAQQELTECQIAELSIQVDSVLESGDDAKPTLTIVFKDGQKGEIDASGLKMSRRGEIFVRKMQAVSEELRPLVPTNCASGEDPLQPQIIREWLEARDLLVKPSLTRDKQ